MGSGIGVQTGRSIAALLGAVGQRGASDLHLSAGQPPLVRVDGEVEALDESPLDSDWVRSALAEVAPDTGPDAAPDTAERDFCFELPNVGRFRVNAYRHHRGFGAAFRALPLEVSDMATLGMGQVFRRMADASHGLVLVTGATGSGKSTTLAALLDHINATRRQHILTIEDPIEFVHSSRRCLVTQRQVGRDTPSFAAALRAALREDPDVILIGEMRDLETIRLALTAAETGHLVLATLHTSSAPKTVDRIIDAFPGGERESVRALFAESLQAVVSQRLLPRIGGGRVAAHEILVATPAVRNLIREHKVAQLQTAMQTSAAQGMTTFEQSLLRLAAEGAIAPPGRGGEAAIG